MTNYEKLMDMTIEEICEANVLELRCGVCFDRGYICYSDGCKPNLARWLKDEAKEQKDESS